MADPADDPGATRGVDFESLFRLAPAGFVVAADDDTILDANDSFLAWTGLRQDEVIGTPFLRMLPVGDRILFSTRARPLLDLSGRVREMAVDILGLDRTRLPATLTASRMTGGSPLTLYVVKPRRDRSFEEAELISAVHRAENSDARRREAEDDLQHLAHHDPVTGLLNRSGLLAAMTSPGPDAGAAPEGMTVFWLGLDHFRVVNDSLSPSAGDRILLTVAERLRGYAGGAAIVARIGGDEFVIVAPGEGSAEAASVILGLIAEPVVVDDLEIVVSASVGVATAPGSDSDAAADRLAAAESLLRDAGTGMYEAKAAGRNRWKRTTARLDDSAVDELRLLGEIRAAIADDQLRLEYQPQLDLRTGRLHGFEALIRWDHPSRGVIAPGGFIDVAEKTGLITQLGTWACRTAIARVASIAAGGGGPVRVSVNISARQLGDAHFAGTVESLLHGSGLRPELLTVELTETGLVTDSPQTADNLRRLHALGVRLSIDDFGTGHAGFAYLSDFSIDEIKLDRSYVSQLGTSAEATAIVVSCIELAHALSIDVVAEGVETPEQLARLTELGCDIVQGFHHSRPLRSDAVAAWVRDRGVR